MENIGVDAFSAGVAPCLRNVVEGTGSAGRCGASQVDLGLARLMLGVSGFAVIANARPLLRRRYGISSSLPGLVGCVGLAVCFTELFE